MSEDLNKRQRFPDADQYREVISRFASGVTVITTAAGGNRFGTTASAVASLSVEPPMLLVCLNRASSTGKAIDRSGYFVVNILTEEQRHLASGFATKEPDKFDSVELREDAAGRPVIHGCIANLECQVTERVTSATHIIFIGLVEATIVDEGNPLIYFRSRFGRLHPVEGKG